MRSSLSTASRSCAGSTPRSSCRSSRSSSSASSSGCSRASCPTKCGTVILDDPDAVIDGEPFAHYVCHITEVSDVARAAVLHPAIVDAVTRCSGPSRWLLEDDRFGVVYQDARPGDRSGYSRIGWHSDAQSGPNLDWWPSVAFTIHLDADVTAERVPARRARVAPRRHRRACRSGSSTCPARSAVYCERGDVLLHHSDLWHSAARATDDGEGGDPSPRARRLVRRHQARAEPRPRRLRQERPPLTRPARRCVTRGASDALR